MAVWCLNSGLGIGMVLRCPRLGEETRPRPSGRKHGHAFFGSGGTAGARGVSLLLHHRHEHILFKTYSERLAVIDLDICDGVNISIIGAYLPHFGHGDEGGEQLYNEIDNNLTIAKNEAKQRSSHSIITADFNAEVGLRIAFDDPEVVGLGTLPLRSHRGDMLIKWATLNDMIITNTHGTEGPDDLWTYKHGTTLKQLDFILVGKPLRKWIVESYVLKSVDVGSDHRPNLLVLATPSAGRTKAKHRRKVSLKHWKPDNNYKSEVERRLRSTSASSMDADEKLRAIQDALGDSLSVTPAQRDKSNPRPHLLDDEINKLIEQRRTNQQRHLLERDEQKVRISTCKRIQALVRKTNDDIKTQKLGKVPEEFCDLQRLDTITGKPRSRVISQMQCDDDRKLSSRQDIAEQFAKFYEGL